MEQYRLEQYRRIFEKYKKSTLLKYGTPDQYQFRKNELLEEIAEFILTPFYEYEQDQALKTESGKGVS